MSELTIEQQRDILYGTYQLIEQEEPALTSTYSSFDWYNDVFGKRVQRSGGKFVEGFAVLDRDGNASHKGHWAKDTWTKKNLTTKYRIDWVHADTGMFTNKIDIKINQGAQLFDVSRVSYRANMMDLIENMRSKFWSVPTSSTDSNSPHSIPSILRLGTDGSTGAWNGYVANYSDGTDYNLGGIASTSSSNANWASWYADDDGDLDDSLWELITRAETKLHFVGPRIPEAVMGDKPLQFGVYTSLNVIENLRKYNRNADDNAGRYISQHFSTLFTPGGTPMTYVEELDTARTNYYGTDPIYGVNWKNIYPMMLEGYDFKVGEPYQDPNRNNVLITPINVEYLIYYTDPRHAGWLISQQ